jgi:hypothetical protein
MKSKNMNDEEITNLFLFLGNEENAKDTVKASNVLFGIENYGLPLTPRTIKDLKSEIEKKKTFDGNIAFDDFKSLWIAKVDHKLSPKELAGHFWNLMIETLEKGTYKNNYDKSEGRIDISMNKNIKSDKLNVKELKILLNILELDKLAPEETKKDNRKNTIESNNTKDIGMIAEEMIKILDGHDDDCITIKDFEFVVSEYLNS